MLTVPEETVGLKSVKLAYQYNFSLCTSHVIRWVTFLRWIVCSSISFRSYTLCIKSWLFMVKLSYQFSIAYVVLLNVILQHLEKWILLMLLLFFVEVEKACAALNGRYFAGRIVTAEKYDEDMFNANDLSGWKKRVAVVWIYKTNENLYTRLVRSCTNICYHEKVELEVCI